VAQIIAVNDHLKRTRGPRQRLVSVNERIVCSRCQHSEGALHGFQRGPEDVHPVNLLDGADPDTDCQSVALDDTGEPFSLEV